MSPVIAEPTLPGLAVSTRHRLNRASLLGGAAHRLSSRRNQFVFRLNMSGLKPIERIQR
jgi:hypothetical protein